MEIHSSKCVRTLYMYLSMTSPVGSHSSVTFTSTSLPAPLEQQLDSPSAEQLNADRPSQLVVGRIFGTRDSRQTFRPAKNSRPSQPLASVRWLSRMMETVLRSSQHLSGALRSGGCYADSVVTVHLCHRKGKCLISKVNNLQNGCCSHWPGAALRLDFIS